jgi:integrase
MTDYVAIANRPSTLREKESALRVHLLPAFGHMKISQITTNIIDATVARWLRGGMSIKRANNIMTILRKSFNCAVEWGLIARAPVVRHHKYFPPIPQYLTRTESQRLLEFMAPGFWKTFVRFLLGTGVRFGEAAALRWDDLDLESNRPTVAIRRGVVRGIVAEPKTRASRRTIVLIPEIVIALRALRIQRPHSDWVFTSPSGQFYEPTRTNRILKNACMKAGVPVISWHKLRHSCATQLLACGVPMPAIKEVLGHTSLEVTSIYAHVVPGLMWEYMQMLSNAYPANDSPLVHTVPVFRLNPIARSQQFR